MVEFSLSALFVRRPDTPVIPPATFGPMGGASADTAEASPAGGALLDDIDGLVLAMEYSDESGARTRRIVECRRLNPDLPGYIEGWCRLRDAERTFRVDRIVSLTNLTTGRQIFGAAVQSFFAPYLRQARADATLAETSARAAERLYLTQRAAANGVKVLLFLAMADGHLHAAEREVVLGYIHEVASGIMPEASLDMEALVGWMENLRPTRQSARSAAVRLSEYADRFPPVARAMLALVKADGVVDEKEEEFVRAIIAAVRKSHGMKS